MGAGVSSQLETRLDRDEIQGTPLVVFLSQRSRVDILREGRVVASSFHDAGNQQLDTSMLPEGAYQVVVRIQEAGGGRREENRFYTRSPRIASAGHDVAFAYTGLLSDERRHRLVTTGGTPFLEAGYARRISPTVAVDATLMASDRTVLGELGSYVITLPAQLRIAALAATDGSYGGVVSLSSPGHRHLNYNFDLRRISVGSAGAFGELAGNFSGRPRIEGSDPLALNPARGSFTQFNAVASYSVARAQLLFSAALRRDRDERSSYSVGPSLRWEVFRAGPLRATVNSDFSVSRTGHSGFLGVSLQVLGAGSAVNAGVGIRSRKSMGRQETAAVSAVEGSWQVGEVGGGPLNLGAGYQDDEGRRLLSASADLRGERIALSGEVSQNLGGSSAGTQYSLGLQTMLTAGSGGVSLNGRSTVDSAVLVELRGARLADRFEVLLNEAVVGLVSVDKPLGLPLPAYRQYEIRVRPTGAAPLRYDDAARTVALYPGNAPRLVWSAEPVVAMFGRIVFPDGTPIAGAQITGTGSISQTDERGFFQLDAAPGALVEVRRADGRTCGVTLPTVADSESFASVGALVCGAAGSTNFAGAGLAPQQPEVRP